MTRVLLVSVLAVLLAIVAGLWALFFRLFYFGGPLAHAPAEVFAIWLLVLLVVTGVWVYVAIPDRREEAR